MVVILFNIWCCFVSAVEKKFASVKAAERSTDILEDNDADFCCKFVDFK